MVLHKLNTIAIEYNLPDGSDSYNLAQLCIASLLINLIKKSKKNQAKIFSELKKKDVLYVVDVGCGFFKYNLILHNVFSKLINLNVKIFAVDKIKMAQTYEPAIFIKKDVRKVNLKKYDVPRIDIITVFNPFPKIPDLTNISKFLTKNTIFLGCVDWNIENFVRSLHENGFKEIVWQENTFWNETRPWFNSYDPFVFAVRK